MSEPQEAGKTILIIDDEADVRQYLSTLLEDNGYKTVVANDGAEGIAKARSVSPALITLDISMPEQSGVKSYRQLKEDPELAKIPVVIVTGVTPDFKKFLEGRKQVPKPEGYIQKPFEKQELLKLVAGLIAASTKE